MESLCGLGDALLDALRDALRSPCSVLGVPADTSKNFIEKNLFYVLTNHYYGGSMIAR